MGFVITGLAIGITAAMLLTPHLINLGVSVFSDADAWRMTFLAMGAATLLVAVAVAVYFRRQEPGLAYGRAALHMGAYAAGGLAAVMAVYFVGTSAGLSDLWIAVVEVALALCLVMAVFAGKGQELGPVLRNRDLWLINTAFIAVLWNL